MLMPPPVLPTTHGSAIAIPEAWASGHSEETTIVLSIALMRRWELKQGYEEVFGPIRSVSSSEYGKFTGSSMSTWRAQVHLHP